ncbi:unnamed protein product [Zymoseptoria tritici ST99CH_1A5]|uniref:RNA-binding protein VTS1 n=2 Tax=Zymoseptoria tritici TaxID=1047171 RepID=A0A2H1H3Z4_ZYMTR|nr:unnamed protein product [Zymoseptoria tritici ST99CH_1E4]SMR63645.1 unnamed protein product [Zymoseptoria tritici ST99CH_3D1]SMY29006.1 unnamed protein product [Zymoseptoria tritici ST99CH_1A5]
MSNIIGNRNSTPEASRSSISSLGSSLRPPTASRTMASGHHLRASADMGAYSATSPLDRRGIRPASEVYYDQFSQGPGGSNAEEVAERAAQQWIADIDQYETTLEDMAAATLDQDFKDELSAIEQWFRVLSEPERTAALYALLQQTTQVQIRFFIQVLQQMAKTNPMSGVLSPAAFGEKDPLSSRMNDAMNKLNVEGSRASFGFPGGKPPPSPGAKRMSGLDPSTIKSMFPDAALAIEDQKAEFQKTTGSAPKSNRNSAVGDRSSQYMPTISQPEEESKRNGVSNIPSGPWRSTSGTNTENQPPIGRPKSSHAQQPPTPMGQFGAAPPLSAGLRAPRPFSLSSGNNDIQSQSIHAPQDNSAMAALSPYPPGASWASMTNTPMVSNFSQQQSGQQADMVANATAMKLAALSTVNNRLQLDDPRKFRRTRSQEGQNQSMPMSPGMPSNILMTNELGQVLSPQQAAALQQHQIAALQARRSRPNSPGIAITGPPGSQPNMGMHIPQSNGYLAAYDGNMAALNNGLQAMSMAQYGVGGGFGNDMYLSDGGMHERGRSPRGRRGSSKPPEDPTDLALLNDIPNWLRTLRLHKYTEQLKDVRWQDLVALDEAGLEAKGVAAKGARTKLLKVFEQVREAQADGRL